MVQAHSEKKMAKEVFGSSWRPKEKKAARKRTKYLGTELPSAIAYTMMKFASFETIVEMLYKYAIPTPKDQCSKSLQLGVSFAGGYVAGVFCAIVSHLADNLDANYWWYCTCEGVNCCDYD